ncbi:MAG TPA: hypothetical protein VMK31_02155 [Sphingomicrobium sp.]|nr:hypothetical protein [Sphingomicrobium sp.]
MGREAKGAAATAQAGVGPSGGRGGGQGGEWWGRPAVLAAVIWLSALPLLYPEIPPLVDLPGHMGRYRVQLDLTHSPWLGEFYGFEWAAIGNLGVDLLVMPLAPLVGLEPAVKLIVVSIPPLTVAGFLLVAREVHGRIPPTAYFAIPFAYGHPFLFGFVNHALSMALAFLAFALWLRLARTGRLRLRAALFVPISLILFFTHIYGWGALGLMCFSAEAVRQRDKGAGWLRSSAVAALHASVMALPLVIMLAWRSGAGTGDTGDWFKMEAKLLWLKTALRDRWELFDFASIILVVLLLVEARRNPRLAFSRNLAFSGLVLLAVFLLLPRVIFGSAYADMRLVPYIFAILVLAIRFKGETMNALATAFAVGGLAFAAVRIAATTASFAIADHDQQAKLEALEHLPMGARVVSLVALPCDDFWALPRNTHLGGMVIVRRHGFSNDQWIAEGTNLLQLRHRAAGEFAADPSQIVRPSACDAERRSIEEALASLPASAFDYLWLIDPPAFDRQLLGKAMPVWVGEGSALYRLDGG